METNKVYIYFYKHTEKLDADVFEKLLAHLSEPLQQEIRDYKHWESAQASLIGKMLLKYGLAQLQLPYTLKDVQIGHKDRPYIHNDFDFNISHSGSYVFLAICKHARVGIDIEKHRALDITLFRKYFNKEEWHEIESAANPKDTFFELWTVKESAIKCDGRGVEVLSLTHKSHNENEITCDGNTFYFQLINIESAYACSVCCDKESKIEIEEVSAEILENL